MEIDPTTSLDQARSDFSTSDTSLQQAGLDRDAFLKIFLVQLQNQDPLNPEDVSKMNEQLATFSQLEQSIKMAEELSGVNERLDRLIDAGSDQRSSPLDPVSLIGHSVDLEAAALTVPPTGDSPRLNIQLKESADFVLIQAKDEADVSIGGAILSRATEDGTRIPLAAGDYDVWLRDGQARVRFPNGEETDVVFEPLSIDEAGNVVIREAEGGGTPISLDIGATYNFDARAARGGSGFSRSLDMMSSGIVQSVRIVDGLPVLTVNNQQVELSSISRIR